MAVLIDLFLLNLAALSSFLLRQNFGDFVIKQYPFFYWRYYLMVLVILNLVYPFIFWLLGLYDRRQKRALLEEFILIFGVISTGTAIMITFFFIGRLWWMSRIVLFAFWGLSIFLLCLSRIFIRMKSIQAKGTKINLEQLRLKLEVTKSELQDRVKEGVSIIIVTCNSYEKIVSCLGSIGKANLRMPHEIIVIDNNSQDDTLKYLSQQKEIKVIKNEKNLGYSKAVNLGLKKAKNELMLILNPDIDVMPGSIEVMQQYLADHPQVGLVGCKLLNDNGTLQYSVRRFLDLRTYLYRFTPLRGLMSGSAIERYYLMQEWDHNNDRLVDWVLGGCMLARKKALNAVDLMDERYFIYFEDVDLCYQLWEKGWQVAYVAEAAMFHKHMRASANKLFNRATYEHVKSLFYFLWKHGLKLPANSPSILE